MLEPDFMEQFKIFLERNGFLEEVERRKIPLDALAFLVGMFIGLAKLPPSEGYEPVLVASGHNRFAARGLAHLAVRHGKRVAGEAKWQRRVNEAIRVLAGGPRQKRALLKRAKILLDALEHTSILGNLSSLAGCRNGVFELAALLKAAVEQQEVNLVRIQEIAAILVPHLPATSGPKISVHSAAHGFLVESGLRLSRPRRKHTRNSNIVEYLDPLTEGTRREFGVPYFRPGPVRRRLRRAARRGSQDISRSNRSK